jgi:hypothetical protein
MASLGSACLVWLAIGALALLPIGMRWFRRSSRKIPSLSKTQRWIDQGFCHACGYNLKGVESYVCPECGVVRLYSARQWKSKLAADAAKLAEQHQQQQPQRGA